MCHHCDSIFVQVTSSDSQLLNVLSPERDSQQEHTVHFPVRLIDSAALWRLDKHDVSIEVRCLATGQVHKIPVSIRIHGKDSQGEDINSLIN